MIIPTPEFDPMYADDGIPFSTKMLRYIEREFADIVAPRPIRQDVPSASSTASLPAPLQSNQAIRAAA